MWSKSPTWKQFADDTALWSSAYTESFALYKLQKSLNLLEGWCRRWRVKLNGDKSKLVLIARTREKSGENHALHLFNDVIRPVPCAKFLGVEIDKNLSFKNHVDSICKRANTRLNVLKVLSRSGTDAATLMRIYKIYVRPIIEYGSIAFLAAPKSQLSRLQSIENDAIRICLRLPKYIRNNLLHDYASLKPFTERLFDLNFSLLGKMVNHNVHVRKLVQEYTSPFDNCHFSPLDLVINGKID